MPPSDTTDKPARRARKAAVEEAAPSAPVEDTPEVGLLPADTDRLTAGIIELLQEDGRMAYAQIASTLGVSEGAVRNRVRQLLNDNVISIQAEALPSAFGYNWNAITFLKVSAGADIEKVAERIAGLPEVYYMLMMTGAHDLGVASYHRDSEDFRKFMVEHYYGHPDITSIETNINLKVYKMKTRWKMQPG